MKFSLPDIENDEGTTSLSSSAISFPNELPVRGHDREEFEGTTSSFGAIRKLPFEVLNLIFMLGVEEQEASVRKKYHRRSTVDHESCQTTRAPTLQLRPKRGWSLQGVASPFLPQTQPYGVSSPWIWPNSKTTREISRAERSSISSSLREIHPSRFSWSTGSPLPCQRDPLWPSCHSFDLFGERPLELSIHTPSGHWSFQIMSKELYVKCDRVTAVNGRRKARSSPPRYFSPITSTTTSMELYGASSKILADCHNRRFNNTLDNPPLIRSLKLLFAQDDKSDYYSLTITPILHNYKLLEHLCIRSGILGLASPEPHVDESAEFTSLQSLDYCMQDLRTRLLYPLTVASPVTITFPSLTHLSLSSNFHWMNDQEITNRAFVPPRTVTHLNLYADRRGFTWVTRECVLQILLPHTIHTLELDGGSEIFTSVAPLLHALHYHPVLKEHRVVFPEMLTLILKGVLFKLEDVSRFVEEQYSAQLDKPGTPNTRVEVQIYACNEDRPSSTALEIDVDISLE
jgi:hypothetical protein